MLLQAVTRDIKAVLGVGADGGGGFDGCGGDGHGWVVVAFISEVAMLFFLTILVSFFSSSYIAFLCLL